MRRLRRQPPQADQLRDQTGEQILRLQKSVAELAAQEKVAQLQNELAQDQLDTITTQLHLGSGASRSGGAIAQGRAGRAHQ